MSGALLALAGVDTYHGNIQALRGVTLDVAGGEIVALIGSNGAGKTTTLRTIAGVLRPRRGMVSFGGRDLRRLPPNEIVRLGIAHSPEGRRIFGRMTVRENLELGAYIRRGADLRDSFERVFTLFPRLRERVAQVAGTLSGGEQQMLAIGRALMAEPKLLLLDEPSMGLAPILVDAVFDTIKDINRQGMTILLVEQNASRALEVAHRAYVLETGTIVMSGTGQELLRSPEVQRAYLGV